MSAPVSRGKGCFAIALLAIIGGCAGLFGGYHYRLPGQRPRTEIHEYPLPHHIPKYEGGVSLRFAMVHDVIHERFPRHGETYYQERNRLARKALAEQKGQQDEAYFALFDDLGAGLDYLKQDDEAVPLLRDKLRQQEALGLKDRQLYTTYANLGTFLIHGSARAGLSGDAKAKERMREGLSFIRKAIEVNPEAHFGREVWQAVAVDYILAVSEDPKLLLRFDMIGDGLADEVDPRHQRSYQPGYGMGGSDRRAEAYLKGERSEWDNAARLRESNVTLVGADPGWKHAVPSAQGQPVPFDEPTLGIIGMWRLGGGASPHFALALGEIMMRVGQRYIAWCAYERAAAMADRAWPDANVQRQFAEHCRRRQRVIEEQLPAEEVKELRPRFEAELAYGQRYQKEYQEYEAERIRAGASLDDAHFNDDFNATHPPIASPVGAEEKFVAEKGDYLLFLNWPVAVFAAGVSACLGACAIRLAGRRER
ncbi:MAG TPA: hypothetical protein VKA46_41270 [Gemmataceae bacterium]|nr:hypothetical protein [Gemmataceae bacterium]